jgi:beta-lactamase class A
MKKERSYENKKYTRREVIIGIIGVLVGASLIAAPFPFKDEKAQQNLGISELLSPMRAIISSKDAIVNFKDLREYLNETYESDPNISVYFEFLNTGSNISINKDAEFFPASLLKVPLAMAVFKKIEQGEWKWGNELIILASDKDTHFGNLYKEETGSRHTIESLVRESLINSDNTAYSVLLRNMESDELDAVYQHLGLEDFFAEDGKISARRYAVVLRSLYNASYLSMRDSEKILELLTETPFQEYLGQGLPEDTNFAHKIGVSSKENVVMDAGIVYIPDRPYLLIVMTYGKSDKEAKDIMKDISYKIYNYVINYDNNDVVEEMK